MRNLSNEIGEYRTEIKFTFVCARVIRFNHHNGYNCVNIKDDNLIIIIISVVTVERFVIFQKIL